MTKDNINELSHLYNLDPEDVFLFYSICYRNNQQRYFQQIINHFHSVISNRFRRVLSNLHKNFVPTQLNHSWDRNKITQNTPQFVIDLFAIKPHQILLITDGTMIYCEKSENFDMQHRDYNDYNKRNCMIFMPIITANGRYVMNIGPFHSDTDNNDESIYNAATDYDYLYDCKYNLHDDDERNNIMFDADTVNLLMWFNASIFGPGDIMIADDRLNVSQ